MGFEFAKVIPELREGIRAGIQAEGGKYGLMNVGGPPSVQLRAAMEEDLHQPHHPGVVNFDAGNFGFA